MRTQIKKAGQGEEGCLDCLSARSIERLLSAPRRIHMLGIGGIGMAGLAFLLHERGHIVTGSDAQENRQTRWLRAKGIEVQDEVPADAEWIIRTRAVPDTHPDVVAAAVPVSWRGEVLPALLRDRCTIAVSGTHGKTTTTSMIAQILDCGYCIGGEVDGFDGTARDGDIMVVEADESDGTVANYYPDIAVITNIEYDHMEHHADMDSFEGCFRKFIAQTKENVVYCSDDPVASRLCEKNPKAVPYGFQVSSCGFQVSLPGRHNRLNAMAAVEVCRALRSLPRSREASLASLGSRQWKTDAEIFQRLENLKPVKRRFEIVFDSDYKIISDYAHHPTEIRALIATALETLQPKRLLGVFQPHRYTRTLALGPDFPPAFQGLEMLWLLPVYPASEEPIKGGTTADLMARFFNDPPSPGTGATGWKNRIKFFPTLEKTWQDISCELREGDVLLIIGAGDIERMGEWSKGVVG
jgi:UDP-N-acetylmuramate-alanine ligase